LSFFITVFPNNQGGVRFMMQEVQSNRVLKQGEFQSEINLSERDVSETFPELSPSDREAFLEMMRRVVESWYPEKFSPIP
jgi:hypothetical protein